MIWNSRVLAFDYLLIQSLHVVGTKRRHKSTHLVEDAAQRPDVTFGIVRLVAPNFRTGIVRSAGLSVAESLLNNFRDVEVTKLCLHVLEQEDVGTLHVSVKDLSVVERPQPSHDLNEHVPDFFLLYVSLPLLIVTNLLKDISIVCVFHHKTQRG